MKTPAEQMTCFSFFPFTCRDTDGIADEGHNQFCLRFVFFLFENRSLLQEIVSHACSLRSFKLQNKTI